MATCNTFFVSTRFDSELDASIGSIKTPLYVLNGRLPCYGIDTDSLEGFGTSQGDKRSIFQPPASLE